MTKQQRETFLMIDGSSLLFRAFYAIRHLSTRDGIATNGVYGFLNMFLAAREKVNPDYILVAFDRSGPTFRTRDYEAYKATREETPSELAAQFGMVKDILDALGILYMDMDGFEADDIIGTAARMASDAGIQSYLLTGDRDYFQLVDQKTTVFYTKKGITELEEVTPDWIQDKYGVRPAQLIDVKALMGDTSDNIPGISGIGEKTALKLVQTHGSLDGVYAEIDQVSGKKLKERLVEGKEMAYLSQKLGMILRTLDLEKEIDDFKPRTVDPAQLQDRFQRLEFQSLAQRFAVEETLEESAGEAAWAPEETWEELADQLRKEAAVSMLAFSDVEEGISEDPVIVAFQKGEIARILDIRDKGPQFKKAFGPLFGADGPRIIGYDIKRDMTLLGRIGIEWQARYDDVMLMEYLLDPNRSNYSVEQLARTRFSRSVLRKEELLGKGKKRISFGEVAEEGLFSFFSGSLRTLQEAAPLLQQELDAAGMQDLYDTIENPLVRVLARIEMVGVAVDADALDVLDETFRAKLEEYEKEVYAAAGEAFNINSPKQLGEILFEKLHLPHGKKTKTGYSTNADVLERLRDAHPIVEAVLNWRKLQKLLSTYVEGLRQHIASDGRIHSTFRQTVAATGRISSTDPNLQNIPVRTEEGRELRKVFVAGQGKKLVDADYSQIELRILAALSGDETMIEAFQQGMDIHRKTAAEVNHVAPEEVTPLQRSYAKAVNFGIIYGISDFGLSRDLNIPRKEAKAYIDSYKETYPMIRQYMETIVAEAKRSGYVDTVYGRRRQIPELKSKNPNLRSFGERVALNTPIQGTAADVIKLAMIRVDQALAERVPSARLVLQIHDELIVETPAQYVEEVGEIVVSCMEEVGDFAVKLVADMESGNSWFEAK